MSETTPAVKPITGRHVLVAMISFFGVIIVVNLTMATLAARSWTGLEAKNGYVSSQDYNKKLAEVESQRKTGWSAQLTHTDGMLTFQISDKAGAPLATDDVKAEFRRPIHENDDRMISLTPVAPGKFEGPAPKAAGLWDVNISLTGPNGQPFQKIYRLNVKN